MKYKLPAVTVVLSGILGGAAGIAQFAPSRAAEVPGHTAATAAATQLPASLPSASSRSTGPPPAPTTGEELLAQSVRQLRQQPGLEARLRQRVDLMGQQLIGSGSYLQWHDGTQLLLRLELKLQLSNQVSSLQQVSDGRFLWTHRQWPTSEKLSRVDLRRARAALDANDVAQANGIASLAPGGLPQLLEALQAHFDFAAPRAEVMPATVPVAAGHSESLQVWLLQGTWKRQRLAQLLPDQREQILKGQELPVDQLMPHLPHGVTVVLARDGRLPLFPFRIQYYQFVPGDPKLPAVPRATKPVVTLELFEVQQRSDLDEGYFQYHPGDQAVVEEELE